MKNKYKYGNRCSYYHCNKNSHWNGGVSLSIPTINSKRFDRFVIKDVISKISSLLGLSITQEATS